MAQTPYAETTAPALNGSAIKLMANFKAPWKMRLFFLQRLPSCLFWGVRIESCTASACAVSLPYRWATQNPFRSIYFAALAGAAELSTGALAMLALSGQPPASMLITKVEAHFIKKADTRTTFTCEDGAALRAAVQQALQNEEGQEFTAISTGRNIHGEVVCTVHLTWSFRKRRKKR